MMTMIKQELNGMCVMTWSKVEWKSEMIMKWFNRMNKVVIMIDGYLMGCG